MPGRGADRARKQETDFLEKFSGAASKDGEAKSAGAGKKTAAEAGGAQNPAAAGQDTATEDMMRFIRERKQEIYEKVQKGETELKIRIGAQEYTEKEWSKLMESFDEAQDELRELLKEEWKRRQESRQRDLEENRRDEQDALEESVLEKLLEDRAERD